MKQLITIICILIYSGINSQQLIPISSENTGNQPILRWVIPNGPMPSKDCKGEVKLERSVYKGNEFSTIDTYCGYSYRNDSLFIECVDSTLVKKHFYEYKLQLNFCEHKFQTQRSLVAHNHEYIPSPRVAFLRVDEISDLKALDIKWKLNYKETVRAIQIFRKNPMEENFEFIATTSASDSSYVDNISMSNEFYEYQLVLVDIFGSRFKSVVTHGISPFKEKPFPPQDPRASTFEDGVLLSWRGLGNNILAYRIYRRIKGEREFQQINKMIAAENEIMEFLDGSNEVQKAAQIEYKIYSVSDGFVESESTETLTVNKFVKKEIPAPGYIDMLIDSTGTEILVWESMEKDENIFGYKLYGISHRKDTTLMAILPIRQNSVLVPKDVQNQFTKLGIRSIDGKQNESKVIRTKAISSNETNYENIIVQAMNIDGKVKLEWTGVQLNAEQKINIYRATNDKRALKIASIDDDQQTYVDNNARPDNSHLYFLTLHHSNGTEVPLNEGAIIRL